MAKPTVAIYGIKDRNTFEYPAYVHDHNLCVMQDGEIVQYLHLERITRRKYDNRLDEFLEDLKSNLDGVFSETEIQDIIRNEVYELSFM